MNDVPERDAPRTLPGRIAAGRWQLRSFGVHLSEEGPNLSIERVRSLGVAAVTDARQHHKS
jgi:hypothetical protein